MELPANGKDFPQSMSALAPKRMNVFERYLSLWVALCMAAESSRQTAARSVHALQRMELGSGSQINIPSPS